MLRIVSAVSVAAAVLMSSSANAQRWSPYPGPGGYYQQGYGYGNIAQSICSGQRGYALENQLRHEEREGEIDEDVAMRIHQSIDRLEDRQRHECAEGDWRGIARIAGRYDRLGQWIQTQAHGYRGWDR